MQENHSLITKITLANNHLKIRTIECNHQTKESHGISHKLDIVDQTVELISIEIIIQDQIQADLSFRLIPVPIQILEILTIPMINLETSNDQSDHIIEIEIIPTIGIETVQME